MKSTQSWIAVLTGTLVLAGVGAAFAGDWPQWRGANRDDKVTDFAAPATWPAALTQKWSVPVGAGDASPVLVGDNVYVFTRQGEEETVLCLNANDGAEVWRMAYATPAISGPDARAHAGPRSTPAVADGKIVLLGVNGVLTCVDAATHQAVWTKDEFSGQVPQFHTSSSPLIVDGMCIAQLGGDANGVIIAYDLGSGGEKWRLAGQGPGYASPVAMDVDGAKQILTMTSKSVVGVALADGKLLWEIPFVPQRMGYNAATLIVDGQMAIYSGASRGTNAVKIEKKDDGYVATPLWSNPDIAVQFNSPVLKDGLLFGMSDRGNLFCIDAKTGQTAWTDTAAHGRGGYSSVLDAGSVMLALPNDSQLIAFGPTNAAYTQLASLKAADTPVFAQPVVTGNRVFVKDQDNLTLWTVE